jgi:hypothetical protein
MFGCLGATGTQDTSSNFSHESVLAQDTSKMYKARSHAHTQVRSTFPAHKDAVPSTLNNRMDLGMFCVCCKPFSPAYEGLALSAHVLRFQKQNRDVLV